MNSTTLAPTLADLPAAEPDLAAAAARARRRRTQAVHGWRLLILLVTLGGWELLSRYDIIDPFFYSRPSDIMSRLVGWTVDGTSEGPLWLHLAVTMEEAMLGFLTGSVGGIVAGIALGRNRMMSDVFSIYIKIVNAVPRVVLAPIFIMIFGLGLGSKVALSFVMVFFVVFSNAFQGVREADRNLIANATILGARGWQLTRTVIVPSAMSWIFASLHVSFGFAVVGAIVGEFVGAHHGIGLLINIAKGTFDAAGMYAAIVIVMIVALAAEFVMTAIENRLARWRPAPHQDDVA